jgi:hypothetical protein
MSDERIIGMLVQFKDDTSRQLEEIKDILKDDHGKRISYLEAKGNRQTGYILGASAALSAFWHYIPKVFSGLAN